MLERWRARDEGKVLKVHRSACYRPERPVCRRRVVCILQDIQRAINTGRVMVCVYDGRTLILGVDQA